MQEKNTDKIVSREEKKNKNFTGKLQKIWELFNVSTTWNQHKAFHKELI